MQHGDGQRRREDGHTDTDVQRGGGAGASGGAREPGTNVNRFDSKCLKAWVDNGTPAKGPLCERNIAHSLSVSRTITDALLSFDPNGTFVLPPSSAPPWFKFVRLKIWGRKPWARSSQALGTLPLPKTTLPPSELTPRTVVLEGSASDHTTQPHPGVVP